MSLSEEQIHEAAKLIKALELVRDEALQSKFTGGTNAVEGIEAQFDGLSEEEESDDEHLHPNDQERGNNDNVSENHATNHQKNGQNDSTKKPKKKSKRRKSSKVKTDGDSSTNPSSGANRSPSSKQAGTTKQNGRSRTSSMVEVVVVKANVSVTSATPSRRSSQVSMLHYAKGPDDSGHGFNRSRRSSVVT